MTSPVRYEPKNGLAVCMDENCGHAMEIAQIASHVRNVHGSAAQSAV